MIAAEPILTVLLFSALAAAAAGLGVLPAATPGGLRLSWLGCAGALASGFMLGAGYILMAVNLHLGIFMAAALAIHNIAEAMTLNWVLLNRRVSLVHSAALGVFSNAPQVLMALVSFAILSA